MCKWCDHENFRTQKQNREDAYYEHFGPKDPIDRDVHSTVTHVTDLEFTGKLSNGATIKGKIDGTLVIDNFLHTQTFGPTKFAWHSTTTVDAMVATIRGPFVPDESGACYYIMMDKEPENGSVD